MGGRLIVVAPLAGLEQAMAMVRRACGLPAGGVVHACGLLGPGMAHPALPVAEERRLRLTFHDVAAAHEGFLSPEMAHVRRLVDFARRWRAAEGAGALLVHCWMGVSRSPAAAYIVQCALHPHADELALAQQLRRLAPFATPNARLVALADELLGRNGRMVAAVAAIGRGEEAAQGRCFVWPLAGDGGRMATTDVRETTGEA